MNHGSKYKTQPLHKCLKEALGHQLLFGGLKEEPLASDIKVAVTSTDGAGKKAVVISNYSRSGSEQPNYEFLRPDDPVRELRVWEAAAATSAATPFFKPYRHEFSGRTYFDGAFYNNNPVRVAHRERQLLWPDVAGNSPDIFLSIGTGQNKRKIDKHRQADRMATGRSVSKYNTRQSICVTFIADSWDSEVDSDNRGHRKPFASWREMFTILVRTLNARMSENLLKEIPAIQIRQHLGRGTHVGRIS